MKKTRIRIFMLNTECSTLSNDDDDDHCPEGQLIFFHGTGQCLTPYLF